MDDHITQNSEILSGISGQKGPAVRRETRSFTVLVCRTNAEYAIDDEDGAYNHVAACMQLAKYGEKGRDRYGHGIGGPVHTRLMRWLRWRDNRLLGDQRKGLEG